MHGALPSARDRYEPKTPTLRSTPRSFGFRVPALFFYCLTAFILLATYARHSMIDKHDPFKCHALLDNGQWIDPPSTKRSRVPFQKWQPAGCTLRTYSSKGIAACLESGAGTDAVFIGDSTVREVFWATARKLDYTAAEKHLGTIMQKHADVKFMSGGVTLDFIWDPFLNSTQMMATLDASRSNAENPKRLALPNSKALVVVGGGLWYARLEGGVEMFKASMDKIADPAHQHHHSDILDNPGANRVFIMPVQPPYYRLLDAEHMASLKSQDIDAMNKYMRDLTYQYDVDILLSYLDMEASAPAYQPNGLHVTKSVADRQAEVILNARCNEHYQSYPYVATCCYNYPTRSAQTVFVVIGFFGLLVLLWIEAQGRLTNSNFDGKTEPLKAYLPLLRPLLVIWAALFYCYLADRTHLFDKVMKQYNNSDFFIFVAGVALVGGLTIKRSVNPSKPNQEKPVNQDQPFLSRDQTDEWKGWMQAMILAYHYTGASQVLWIYRLIRLLVSSYLFMTGYGHAAYFYQKNDFSLKRVVAVNIRLNLLSCLLPWMMDSDYLFYYFAPLVTYWYAVVYLTMGIKSSWNKNMPFFLAKIAISAAFTSILHTQPRVFEPFFTVINAIFASKWDAREWVFRCALDQYIVYIGMVVAVVYIRRTHPPAPPPPPQDTMANTAHKRPGAPPQLNERYLYLFDVVALLLYSFIASSRTTKTGSNAIHPYISPLPVLAFIHLRNATPALRNNYSSAYSWLGKISLETFVLQYHIWLAADTKGLLSLGLFGSGGMSIEGGLFTSGMGLPRWFDCTLLGIAFIWISWKVATATGAVTAVSMKLLFPSTK